MANNKTIQALLLVAVFVVMAALVLVLNIFTAPLIEANAQGAELEPLYGVMPEASGFEKLELNGVPETVSSVWKEKGGLGYVVRCAANKGFTGDYIELTVAITVDGKISGISLDSYPETKDFGQDTYPATFMGQDSTLAGTSIVAGVTYSSSAFRNAVADAFEALISNGLIKAGVKEPSQVISEMLPVVFKTAANPAGIAQISEFSSAVAGVKNAWKTNNGIGVAYWYENGDDYLVIFNSSLSYKVFDLESNDVTSSFDAAVAESLSSEAAGKMSKVASKDKRKVTKLVPEDSVLEQISVDGVFNSVATVFRADSASGTYYCFTCRPYGFSNETMVIYVVLDSNGLIYTFNADELIIEAEYFSAYTLEPTSYKAGFVGLGSSWSGDEATISGATMTSQAVRCAIDDAFEAFGAVAGGNN